MQRVYLSVLVFWGGLVTLGAEMAASRLLAPYFGTSLMVWSSLIGLILVCLAVGYWVGGAWADRSPDLRTLLRIAGLGAVATALVPFMSRPVLGFALEGFAGMRWGLFLGSFVGVLFLMSLPMVLLGCITPFAIRLWTRKVEETGRAAGRLFAFSTVGSFVGAFLPVMVLIPSWGTRNTYLFLSLSMLAVVTLGWVMDRRPRGTVVSGLSLVVLLLLGVTVKGRAVKSGEGVIYEDESAYHYIRVVTNELGWTHLQLNEGVVQHSAYHPSLYFTGGEWDYMAIAPCFNPAPFDPLTESRRWAMVGLGAGTTARLVTETYGPVPIDGVELDAEIVEVGRRFFGMTFTNLHVDVSDGRPWLSQNTNNYDVISVDAYRQPYIPFELTTAEFFRVARARLTDKGVLAINVGRTPKDLRLVDALGATMADVFDSVFFLDVPHKRNTIIVGTVRPATLGDFRANANGLAHPVLRLIARRAVVSQRPVDGGGLVLTDDRAPVERLMDLLVVREIMRLQ